MPMASAERRAPPFNTEVACCRWVWRCQQPCSAGFTFGAFRRGEHVTFSTVHALGSPLSFGHRPKVTCPWRLGSGAAPSTQRLAFWRWVRRCQQPCSAGFTFGPFKQGEHVTFSAVHALGSPSLSHRPRGPMASGERRRPTHHPEDCLRATVLGSPRRQLHLVWLLRALPHRRELCCGPPSTHKPRCWWPLGAASDHAVLASHH